MTSRDNAEGLKPDQEHQESRTLFESVLRGEISEREGARWRVIATRRGTEYRALMVDTQTLDRVELYALGDKKFIGTITASYTEWGQSSSQVNALSHAFSIEKDGLVDGYLPLDLLRADEEEQTAAGTRAELTRTIITEIIKDTSSTEQAS